MTCVGNKVKLYSNVWRCFVFAVSVFGALFSAVFASASDTTPPYSTVVLDPASPEGNGGWYLQTVMATVFSQDLESGVNAIRYRLNSGSLETKNFTVAPNLVSNYSFEDTLTGSWIKTGGSSGDIDTVSAQDGARSIYLESATGQTGCWGNNVRYIPADSLDSFSVSAFVKGVNIFGTGAYLDFFALTPSGSQFIGRSEILTGSFDWKIISLHFVSLPADTYGVYVNLCLTGTGRVNFDSIFQASVDSGSFVIVPVLSSGENILTYFASDAVGNIEPAKSAFIKIDTRSPTGWSNFSTEQSGNDHTFISSIDVFDRESGLKEGSDKFQYSVDGGASWGYYQNFGSCNGSFVSGGWIDLNSSFINGERSATLTTPEVNYCNSNWKVCKTARFYVEDISGRSSTKDICLYGPWFKSLNRISLQKALSLKTVVRDRQRLHILFSPEDQYQMFRPKT